MSNCFWILTDGTIVIPDSLHILAVVSDPVLFGESDQTILEKFHKYGQNINSNIESKAREEVLLRVIRRNHIRIRKNIFKKQQKWSIQLYRLNDQSRTSISIWATLFKKFDQSQVNKYKFFASAAGVKLKRWYIVQGMYSELWTSSNATEKDAYNRTLAYSWWNPHKGVIRRTTHSKNYMFSVRCIKI